MLTFIYFTQKLLFLLQFSKELFCVFHIYFINDDNLTNLFSIQAFFQRNLIISAFLVMKLAK